MSIAVLGFLFLSMTCVSAVTWKLVCYNFFKFLCVRIGCIILKEQAHRASRFCQYEGSNIMKNVFNIKLLLWYFNIIKFSCMTQLHF